jgi:hypothetical protein
MKPVLFFISLALFLVSASAQSKADYGQDQSSDTAKSKGLLDLSRLSVSHSMSFGAMSGGGYSSIQSQSFYSTMLQYRFAAPVTLNLNFSLPIYSTMSPYQNLTSQNMQSLNYFKNIPMDVSLSWKPSDRFQFNFSVVNYPSYYGNGMYNGSLMPWSGPMAVRR